MLSCFPHLYISSFQFFYQKNMVLHLLRNSEKNLSWSSIRISICRLIFVYCCAFTFPDNALVSVCLYHLLSQFFSSFSYVAIKLNIFFFTCSISSFICSVLSCSELRTSIWQLIMSAVFCISCFFCLVSLKDSSPCTVSFHQIFKFLLNCIHFWFYLNLWLQKKVLNTFHC